MQEKFKLTNYLIFLIYVCLCVYIIINVEELSPYYVNDFHCNTFRAVKYRLWRDIRYGKSTSLAIPPVIKHRLNLADDAGGSGFSIPNQPFVCYSIAYLTIIYFFLVIQMLLEAVSSCIQLFEVKFGDSTKLKIPKCKSPIFLPINHLIWFVSLLS